MEILNYIGLFLFLFFSLFCFFFFVGFVTLTYKERKAIYALWAIGFAVLLFGCGWCVIDISRALAH